MSSERAAQHERARASSSGLFPETRPDVLREYVRLRSIRENFACDAVSAQSSGTPPRKTFDGGADLRHVTVMLGHRSLRTTQEYLRLDAPGLREAMKGRSSLRE